MRFFDDFFCFTLFFVVFRLFSAAFLSLLGVWPFVLPRPYAITAVCTYLNITKTLPCRYSLR